MDYVTHSFRHAEAILGQPDLKPQLNEIIEAIKGIHDADLIVSFNSHSSTAMSLSRDVNGLLKTGLQSRGWAVESAIFQNEDFDDKRWRLDFAKEKISIEVAFNHGEAIAWNLLKPVLASELNHVQKAVQTEIGVVICATAALKASGGFDNAVGEYEKFLRYLDPLQDVLTTPMLIIGLEAPKTFRIKKTKVGTKTIGEIEMISEPAL
jgi:hypothetical protein